MDRDRLLTALRDAGDAARLCREALLAGAEVQISPGSVPTTELRTIYRSRAEHLRTKGIASVGADEAADELDRTTWPALRIGRVSRDGQGLFQVFLDPGLDHVVACVALPQHDGGA